MRAFAFAAAIAAASAAASEKHYLTTYHGQVIGVRTVKTTDDGMTSEIRETMRVRARGMTTTTETARTEVTDPLGRAVSMQERRREGGQVAELTVEVSDGQVTFRTRAAGVRRQSRAELTEALYFDLDGRALARAGELRAGGGMKAAVIGRIELGIAELAAEVLGVEDVALVEYRRRGLAPEGPGYRVRVANTSGAGEPWDLLIDSEGGLLELTVGPMNVRRVKPEEARLPRVAMELDNTIPSDPLGDTGGIERLTVRATVAEDAPADVFPESAYCVPERVSATEVVLRLREVRPDGRIASGELGEDDRRRFTSPSALVESDSPLIRSLARDILEDEDEPLAKCMRIVAWVHGRLRKTSAGPANASALEALRSRTGDCTEHAAVTVALARAAGLPARQALGLVHDGNAFQFHAWAEVFVDDRWVPADATLGRVGVPGVYVLLGAEGEMIGYHTRANFLQGRTTMRVE